MPVVTYTESSDYTDCEQCGGNYATGIVLSLDGHEIVSEPASAACYGGTNWDLEKALIALLIHEGYAIQETDEDGDIYDVSVDEHGNILKIDAKPVGDR